MVASIRPPVAGEALRHTQGLAPAEAAARLQQQGPNRLPPPPTVPAWRLLIRQLTHFFALMLWVAGILAIVAGMPQLGLAIFVVILLNGLFAFAQEYRAERAAARLRDLLPRRATVIRGGVAMEIDAGELVTGDTVTLVAGDRVSADLHVAEATDLTVDTSLLTGESVPVPVEVGGKLFAGTFVVEGEAMATVSATGARTRLAAMARLTQSTAQPPSPMERELNRLVRVIAAIAAGMGAVFLVVALLAGLTPLGGFLFAIGVTVALVPEGLLPTITLALAIAAQRMAKRRALVRRLEAVETLGSATFICTDKTGTLTLNQMTVVEAWTPMGDARIAGPGYRPDAEVIASPEALPALRALALAARRCSRGRTVLAGDGRWQAQGDPMEAALDALAHRLRLDLAADEQSHPAVRWFPFDPRRRRMAVLLDDRLVVKGAPDAVLPRCQDADAAAAAAMATEAMAQRGRRVIAVAARPVRAGASAAGRLGEADVAAVFTSADQAERGLTVLGLLGIEDPPRPGAAEAIAACRRAGIRVAMVTGDHPATAEAVAREAGLLPTTGPRERTAVVLEGRDLPADEPALGGLVDQDGVVISRVTPEDKVRIARALRARGHVVAMTGDGVNDGPALHEADIGIAMGGQGTDVAREAADLVLLDDDFATIVVAVEQGRAVFANVRRFLTYHLTDNVAELTPFVVWALSGGRFPLAIGVLQVLCLDLGTDVLPALALGVEAPTQRTLQPRARQPHLVDQALLARVFGVLGPVEAMMEMSVFLLALGAGGWRPGAPFPTGAPLLAASGAAFSAVVFGQVANAFVCRSTTRRPGALGWTTNRALLGAVAMELVVLVALLGVPPLAALLGQAPPSPIVVLGALLSAPAVLAADAVHKRWRSGRARGGSVADE